MLQPVSEEGLNGNQCKTKQDEHDAAWSILKLASMTPTVLLPFQKHKKSKKKKKTQKHLSFQLSFRSSMDDFFLAPSMLQKGT